MTEMDVTPETGVEDGGVEVGVETPEADAVEQAQGSDSAETPAQVQSIPDDVPEADALEQSYEVELDEDYRA
jgi:hypothetical protein